MNTRFVLFLSVFYHCYIDGSLVTTEKAFSSIPSISTEAYNALERQPKGTRFIIVRHGESTSNKEKSIAGRTLDADLSEAGVEQAREVGRRLLDKGVCIDAIYSSQMLRARETARIIAQEIGVNLPIGEDRQLCERYFGPYEGVWLSEYMPVIEAEIEKTSGVERSYIEKFNYKFHEEMESYAEAHKRFFESLENLSKNHEGQTVLIASHGAIMKSAFIADAYAKGYEVDYHSFILNNCAILIFDADGDSIEIVASNNLYFR